MSGKSKERELNDRALAIASVIWLLPAHYTMIRIGGHGACYFNELEMTDKPEWHPPSLPEYGEEWPVEAFEKWFRYQRYLSYKYELLAVGKAFDRLQREYPVLAAAVRADCVEIPEPNWYEPERLSSRSAEGLRLMAEWVDVHVPFFEEEIVVAGDKSKRRRELKRAARNRRIKEMVADGCSQSNIARDLRCSTVTIQAVNAGKVVRHGRIIDAGGDTIEDD